jgi:hypothetical protein
MPAPASFLSPAFSGAGGGNQTYLACDVLQCTFALNADEAQFLQSLAAEPGLGVEENLPAQVAAWCNRLSLPVQGAIEIATSPCLALAWGMMTELDYATPEFLDAAQSGQGICLSVGYTFGGSTPIFNSVAVTAQGSSANTPC